jgi:hypothetical protein
MSKLNRADAGTTCTSRNCIVMHSQYTSTVCPESLIICLPNVQNRLSLKNRGSARLIFSDPAFKKCMIMAYKLKTTGSFSYKAISEDQ